MTRETPSDQSPPVPEPTPGTDEDTAPETKPHGHDGAEHYPTEDDPA